MPIPKPNQNEDEQGFISRCISELFDEYGQEQSAGICYSQWRQEHSAIEVFEDYPWNECTSDQLEKGYDEETANKICGFIRWANMSEEFATLPTEDCVAKYQSAGYNEKDAKQACSPPKMVPEDEQQGGVVGFARVKFEYPPMSKEKMNDFMARCMADSAVREKKPNRSMRGGFCWSEYQNNYVMSIGSKWK